MNDMRKFADGLELIVAKTYWPMPTYQDILFY
jgi:glutamine synthetase type III